MKKSRTMAIFISLAAVLVVVLSACGKSSNQSNQQASFRNEVKSTKATSVQSQISNNSDLWYLSGGINSKSNSGFEAYKFDKDSKKVTIYNVSKYYKTYSAAQKANALSKEGTLSYSFGKNSKSQTVIKFKGKLSDIPMTQTFTVKDTTTGKNKSTRLHVTGYKIVRDIDEDKTNNVFVKIAKE
ncbi:hypothetical protein [Secundilactobacillus malefermentans]|jgi:mRNA-degrading endonuclease RelE of RelBE toxin-antitoxin system|uniref:Lipoprotein n=1 Tax=Secundilactobacillus malefermentans TaxID=176292 RepID=A0A4R5NPT6_9LACO|nr:hypothetical protein [Secundilactobacillus malefermentans]KRM58467.1 hypothetical protein FD44_GL000663 [Secundilactobacillus malefermentans DSM 5705 = KCTC 3548]QEA31557.1 hypothetical protein FGL90_04820 [Secundilactobacillus malefermentans]TDG78644.1 hypothetical protein C5L31_001670 [Secundilactobacillus malefermentans]